jgi:hypothetical protein
MTSTGSSTRCGERGPDLVPHQSTRIIANYLPQFHPVPENDEWWGPGFTEWINVAKARPLFRGHRQPNLPGELGFYDLRLPETREQQACLARQYGVFGFCYWHYWLGNGRRILERPFAEVLATGEPDYPFCLGWANADWTGVWYGASDRVLLKQEYPGASDDEAHFRAVEPAFHDPRYIRVDGNPIFYFFHAPEVPHLSRFIDRWRELAQRSGLPGIHFIGELRSDETPDWSPMARGLDASVISTFDPFFGGGSVLWRARRRLQKPQRAEYRRGYLQYPRLHRRGDPSYPYVLANFDNTPRCGRGGVVLVGSAPTLFEEQLRHAVGLANSEQAPAPLIFLRSWNEWAEGNYVEPDRVNGRGFLEVIRRVQTKSAPSAQRDA